MRELPPTGFQQGKPEIQDPLSLGHSGGRGKAKENGLLQLRHLSQLFPLFLKAAAHGLEGVHFLFQQEAAVGVAPADGGLLVLHLVPDAEKPVHLFLEFGVLLAGDLGLVAEFGLAAFHVLVIRQAGHGGPGGGLPPQGLQMDDDIGGVSDQGFIVGDEEHGPGPGLEKLLQKLKGLQVQIIGRLIQQEQLRLLCQKPGQLELHPLAAGQLPQKAVPAGQIRREAQGGQKDGFLWRGEDRALTPEGADRLLQGLGRQLLGQISHPGLAPLDLPGPLGIIGNERFIKKKLQQGGLSVALFADDGSLIPRLQNERKIRHHGSQVLGVGDRQMIDLEHDASLRKIKSASGHAEGRRATCTLF